MNFLKKLFTAKSHTQINTRGENDLSNIEQGKDVSHTIETRESKPINIESSLLTEDEKNYLIDKFVQDEFAPANFDIEDLDPLFDDAAKIIVMSQMGSTALLQRRMKLGYNRAGRLMDQLEAACIVGPNQGSKIRDVLIGSQGQLENLLSNEDLINRNSHKRINKAQLYELYKDEIENKKLEYLKNVNEQEVKNEKELIRQSLLEKERKKQLQKEVLKELIEQGLIFNQFTNKEGKRESIPQDVLDKVWNRDGGRCVQCGNQENLEFDHIIPFSKGGATTYRNLQILCKKCNISKSNKIG